ncbi:TPA: lysis protein [Proteus mirabilis]|uniref:lysis protein n=1 Tax=Proteus mirabilis TaxID=584 RepID=UPI000E07AF8C|nr:lysis protein [Proteus mirabilis]KAB7722072.1 lysis protein [Proteus mirabilis]MDL2105135.1 lysis protein [Proteus mirabilis]MDM3777724.1 lysis protein [Proteus mirabilis]QIJ54665.1 lysis protein [Proteus mirabilis]SUC09396.1 phage endopeptidase (lysis protein) [Proteus mirabilis]
MNLGETIVSVGVILAMIITIEWQSGRIDKLKNSNAELTTQLSQQVEINKDYQARITRLNQLDVRHSQELASAKNEIDRLRDAVSSGSKRVYVKAECPAVTKNPTESGSNEATARLNKAVEQDYLRLREMIVENEQQTLYLQDYIRTECLQ